MPVWPPNSVSSLWVVAIRRDRLPSSLALILYDVNPVKVTIVGQIAGFGLGWKCGIDSTMGNGINEKCAIVYHVEHGVGRN